jgi:2-polyprenyl-3-methyl-5-hydroxy-6-metoxy-1,4-benzoquinol methylase
MSKKEHDEITASRYREVNYQKIWYLQGINILNDLKTCNFQMLDLGCGNGEFSEIAREKFGAAVTCMDYSESHLERVKQLGFNIINCNFDLEEDVNKVNQLLKEKFDLVVTFEVIEHIFDVDVFLATAHNLLKKDGYIIISTPNISYFGHRIYSMFRGNLPVSEGHHIRFFSPKRLKQIMVLNGFDIIQDYSLGQSDYYIDRTIGENTKNFRAFLINTVFLLGKKLCKKSSSSRYSNLVLLAKKVEVTPIGLDPTFRQNVYNKLSYEEKKKVILRLITYRNQFFFDEHPGLRKFLDSENSTLFA